MVSRLVLAAAFVLGLSASEGWAADLSVGLAVPPTTMDPHFQNFGQNNSQARHVFDTLSLKDENEQPMPGLALSWKTVAPTVWEYKLREGVRFHDGSPFTAADVVFSIDRATNVADSPTSFAQFTKAIAKATAVDDYTVRFETTGSAPLLPNDLANVWIISKKNGDGAKMEDYNSGKAMVGTGPYKFVSWVPGDRIVYERNPDYWGGAEPWDKVTFRIIPSGPARVAALLAGDVDLVSDVPTTDVEQLKENKKIAIFDGPADRNVFVVLDVDPGAPNPKFLSDKSGDPLKSNPLADVRVRQALSYALDRTLLIDRIMGGQAVASGQFVPEGFFGWTPGIEPDPLDLAKAKQLLAEAGYPDGFKATLVSSNDRIINAVKLAQAIAQSWARLGVNTSVDTMPHAVFSPRRNNSEFPIYLNSWGNSTGEASSSLVPNFHTRDIKKGLGTANRHRFSDKELDAILEEALATIDDDKRRELLQKATRMTVESKSFVPLFLQVNIWGARNGLKYGPMTDGSTLGMRTRQGAN